jgi:thymidylate kinase
LVEGADGCGKTTVAKAIANYLSCRLLHFPDDEAVTGPMIREYLKNEWSIACEKRNRLRSALAFQALQVANRMEHMTDLERCADHPTRHIVLARYWQSGWVYGQLDGLDGEWLRRMHKTMAEPDLSILLDIEPKTSMDRRAARDGELPPERYEGKVEFTTKVVQLYRDLWPTTSGVIVDANDTLRNVKLECLRHVNDLLA